jgi:hypothetical protein
LATAFLAAIFLAGAFLALAFLATFFTDTRGTLCPFTALRHPRHAFGATEGRDGLD